MRKKTKEILRNVYFYSGGKFIVRKFIPEDKKTFPTGFIWLIGIYVAFFGIASNRYENRVDIIENRINAIFTQLSNQSIYKKALNRIPAAQNMWCPMKPEILKPWTVFGSLLFKGKYNAGIELLKETLEDWKDSLESVDLKDAILDGIDFNDANLEKASFSFANLKNAKLIGANLRRASFGSVSLEWANLAEANLEKAYFSSDTDFKEAFLRKANLKDARFSNAEKLCEAMTLYETELNQSLEKTLSEKCPHLLKKPKYEILQEKFNLEWISPKVPIMEVLKKYERELYKNYNQKEVELIFQYNYHWIMNFDPESLPFPGENIDKKGHE